MTDSPPPRRDTPNPDRPRLSRRREEEILPLDQKAARAYNQIEEAIARSGRAPEPLEEGAPVAPLELTESVVHDLADTDVHPAPPITDDEPPGRP